MAQQPSPARMEAFSDGVIAVIITIMVLDLKVPHVAGFAGLRIVLPTLAVYFVSFTFVGVYWINHHHLVDRLEHTDALILWANLFFLFFLSLLPFFTAYLIDSEINSFSVQTYVLSLLVTGLSFQLLSRAMVRHFRSTMGLSREQEWQEQSAQQHFAELAKGWLSAFLYLSAVVLAHWLAHAALALAAAVTVLWIIPSFGLKVRAPAGLGAQKADVSKAASAQDFNLKGGSR